MDTSKKRQGSNSKNDAFKGDPDKEALHQQIAGSWFSALLENSPVAVMAFKAIRDNKHKIIDLEWLFVNKKALTVAGRDELNGKLLTKEFPGMLKTGLLEKYVQVTETGVPWEGEFFYNEDGFTNWLYIHVSPLNDGCLVSYFDITEKKKTEDQVKDLNQALQSMNRELSSLNSELKTFTGIAANDYNETLKQLYVSLELIISNDAQNMTNAGRANIRRAQSAVQKLKLLTDDLVSYSKLQELETRQNAVDLNTILENVLQDFEKKSALFDADIECSPLPSISGYPFLISLVFHHLIENAIRFRKDEHAPHISITCKESVKGSEAGHSAAHPGMIYHIISVKDNGIGFPQEEMENIFGIFYRLGSKSKNKGSGIGLAICKKIMDMHGGFITAESTPDAGAEFHCYFPAPID